MLTEITLEPTPWKISLSGSEEIIQNVKCILLTAKGTAWNYRDFGISAELIDKPLPVAKNRFLSEVVKQVAKYESRARVKGVRYAPSNAADGELSPVITIEIRK